MRLVRSLALAAAIVAAVAAWPQRATIPPTVDHTQHQVVDTPLDGPVPSIAVSLTPDAMDGYNLLLETTNYRFTPENVDTAIVPNEGHAHLYLNGEKVARLYSRWRHLPRAMFQDGVNRLQVELNANDHSIWGLAGEPIGADVLVDAASDDRDPIVREQIRYTLDWEWGAAQPNRGGGWTVVNDLGYRVKVSGGTLVTRGLELLPCHTMPAAQPMALLRWLRLPSALAGHSSLLPNESRITNSYTEDLSRPQARLLESRVVTDPEYCQAHYLAARPRGTGPGATVLELTGEWSRDSGARSGSFEIRSTAAYGEIKELLSGPDGLPAPRSIVGGLEVSVVRSLGSLFDGIDFASANPDELGMALTRTLVSKARVVAGARWRVLDR